MAEIADPSLVPQPRLGAGGLVDPRRAAAPLGAASSALGEVVDYYLELEQTQAQFRRDAQAGRAKALYAKRLNDERIKLADDDDPATRPQRFAEFGAELSAGMAGELEDPAVREEFELHASEKLQAQRMTVFQAARRQEIDTERANLADSLKIFSDSAAAADTEGNPLARDLALEDGVMAIEDTPLLDDLETRNETQVFLKNHDKGRILLRIEQGKFDEARLLLAAHDEELPALDVNERLALGAKVDEASRRAEQKVNEARSAANDRRLFDLSRDVREAGTVGSPSERLESIEAVQADVMKFLGETLARGGDVGKVIALDAQVFRNGADVRADLRSSARIEQAIEHGWPLDPDDADDLNAYYTSTWLPARQELPPEELFEEEIGLIEAVDIIPKARMSQIRGLASSDDPAHVAAAAEQYARIAEASPQARTKFTAAESVFLENMNRGIRLNQDPAALLERERETAKLDPTVRKLRDDIYEDAQRESLGIGEPDAEWLLSQDAVAEIQRGFAFDPNADEIPTELLAPFSAEVKRWHQFDPDIPRARQRAVRALSQTWGTTEVGGERRIMHFAPEKMYPGFRGDSAMIQRQLVSDIQLERVDLAQEDLSGRLQLVASPQAQRQLPTPGYFVWMLDEEGLPVEQVTMQDGSPLEFFPSVEATPEFAEETFRNEAANADAAAAKAYLDGEGPLSDIKSASLTARTAAYKAGQVAFPIISDPEGASAEVTATIERINASQQAEAELTRLQNEAFVDALAFGAESLAAVRGEFAVQGDAPASTVELRAATEAAIQARARAFEASVELLRGREAPTLEEPQFGESFLGRMRRP